MAIKKMDPEVKKKWLEALRSGKYKQGKGKLKRSDTYCCLGVLCDLYIQELDAKEEIDPETVQYWEEEDQCYDNSGELPYEVIMWADLNKDIPDVRDGTRRLRNLAELNDGTDYIRPRTFEQIANYIEKSL